MAQSRNELADLSVLMLKEQSLPTDHSDKLQENLQNRSMMIVSERRIWESRLPGDQELVSSRTKTVKGLLQPDVGYHTGIFNRSWNFLWCAASSGPRVVISAMLSPDLASEGAISVRKTSQMTMSEETSFDPSY